MSDLADRRARKLRRKSNSGEQFEITVAGAEFSIDRKAAEHKAPGDGIIFFEGYAAIFNTPDSYKDIILPGAFKTSIKEKGPREEDGRIRSDVKSLWQHNPDWPFGLPHHLEEDSTGLFHRTMVSNTNENMERLQYMEDGVVTGESIGFMTKDYEWDEEDEEDFWPTRYLKDLDLWEHSPVTFAAHSEAVTTLIQRNRELALAVRNVDHGGVLATAYGMKGISMPMVEQAISVLTSVKEALPGEADDEGETDTGEDHDKVTVDDVPDTSEDDPVLVNALESFALGLELEQAANRLEKEATS